MADALQRTTRDVTKGRTYAALLLDASASMEGARATQLLEGAADFLDEVARLPVAVDVAFDLFGRKVDYGDFTPAHQTEYLTRERYRPNKDSTAILDSIHAVVAHVQQAKRAEDGAVVYIFTDGQENASEQHDVADTRALILRKRQEGWTFIFAGPGGAFATSIGIDPACQLQLQGNDVRAVLAQATQVAVRALLPQASTIHL